MKRSDKPWLSDVPTFYSTAGMGLKDQTFFISVMAELIVEVLFMLFSICSAV